MLGKDRLELIQTYDLISWPMPEVDMEILHETRSLCPVCLRRLDARYVRRGQSVLLERTCPEHGTFAVAVWHERTEGGRHAAALQRLVTAQNAVVPA